LAVVNGKTLLQRNIEYLQGFGIYDVVVNVHHFADQIIHAVQTNQGWGSHVCISNETDALLDTGGGLLKAAPLLSNATEILVMNADMLTNLNLLPFLQAHQSTAALATLAVQDRKSSRYLLFGANHQLCGWENIVTGEQIMVVPNLAVQPLAFSGIQLVQPALLQAIQLQGKFSMIDVYLGLATQHRILAYPHNGDLLLDVGKPESLAKAQELFAY
jgi:N-acetyl-alpha-D-muramate 1-phosphate uridylyltransferase